MSAIKGIKKDPESITKDYESITKDYETLFYSIKDNVKKFSHYISGHTFQFPSIGRECPAVII